MHMSDALLSPAVGGAMWGAAGATLAYCSRRVQRDLDERFLPLMGVMGAFVFAAQMINFAIPGTGSSGHLGGGLLLAILLGPAAGFLTLASVLTIQALFFADGGLLALGCNIFNLGFFPCFVAYPLIYRPLAARSASGGAYWQPTLATVLAAVLALQAGSLGVVLQTVLSGVADLPLATFALLMQPIHLPIGVVEGVVTASVLAFLRQARPDLVLTASAPAALPRPGKVLAGFFIAALLTGGILSWFASERPDGLEWSIEHAATGESTPAPPGSVHEALETVQQKTVLLPDYRFRGETVDEKAGSSASGVIGSALTLLLAAVVGILLRRRNQAV